ncbi:uncharacterized protein LACBIDRAFT_188344 [Laccaria bicolor S238N-H82]|uniref:Predicted protein n=1 Tax=Laccaria bicolor (strain S238N-H82 / ATCC MYA-4686) TaxID=486041 RepID=B0CVV2_LACBS|nr:uncharacterized protein LACBIDRAFT_188344 [Laccaria bicolor S238N-H82]EDR13810.1 predicted protein [Laccaria bicolor S238N-H82]|eukprot:XP_001876308.1 predicted protein [Laccaria bicolor S238N-H82]
MVRYASNTPPQPVPPRQVLERAGSALEATSSAAASVSPSLVVSDEVQWGDVVFRDRMLVRILYTRCETLSHQFDESINRTTRDLHYEDWAEFLVAWRRDSLEIYEDHSFPGKEMFTKHKHLSYVIPLKSSRTHLSLYSFVDLSFCLTCPPTTTRLNASSSRWIFNRAKEGTNIFIFKLRSRSRAYDWFWLLWRHMGGQLPATLDIRNPQLNTKVSVDIPEGYILNSEKLYSMFRRENIISLCMDTLQAVPQWYHLIERELEKGKALQLCWRVDSNVDWVWLDDDVYGVSREWSVLCGLAFKQAMRPPILELRLANHAPTHFHLRDGTHIDEPPSIEGYLERVKPGSQIKQLLYLTTHNGNVFITHTYHAYPPAPPGIALPLDLDGYVKDLHHAEVLRGSRQILHATGVCDLRSIVAIQRDEGGGHDRPGIKLRRAFELLLDSGNVVRFEAHSCRVALEWINRLRALIAFWKHRHRIDAKEEIELAQDFSTHYPAMDSLYNMCILDGCKPIVKGGKVYTRKGYRGQYKLVQLFLVAGNLVQFRIEPRTTLHKAMKKKISLIDAYVCSGYFAALTLPKGQFRPNAEPAPRRYQDGLETDDRDEDMILTVWFRSHLEEVARDQDPTTAALKSIATTPPLSAKRRTFVIRTRSKVECDAWCWALNSEIEKIVRAQREREERIRDSGNLVELA